MPSSSRRPARSVGGFPTQHRAVPDRREQQRHRLADPQRPDADVGLAAGRPCSSRVRTWLAGRRRPSARRVQGCSQGWPCSEPRARERATPRRGRRARRPAARCSVVRRKIYGLRWRAPPPHRASPVPGKQLGAHRAPDDLAPDIVRSDSSSATWRTALLPRSGPASRGPARANRRDWIESNVRRGPRAERNRAEGPARPPLGYPQASRPATTRGRSTTASGWDRGRPGSARSAPYSVPGQSNRPSIACSCATMLRMTASALRSPRTCLDELLAPRQRLGDGRDADAARRSSSRPRRSRRAAYRRSVIASSTTRSAASAARSNCPAVPWRSISRRQARAVPPMSPAPLEKTSSNGSTLGHDSVGAATGSRRRSPC